MGLIEPGCKSEDFGRLVQPAATNRLRCRVNGVSERYLVETHCFDVVLSMVCLVCAWLSVVCFVSLCSCI